MPVVEVQGQEIEFPDTMSQEQIKSVLRQKFPPKQFGDTARRYAGLALRSAGETVGGLADIPSMAYNLGAFTGEKLAGTTGTPRAPYPSKYISKGMTAVGIPEPKGIGENVAVYGGPIIAGGISGLAKGAIGVGKGILASGPEAMAATGQAIKKIASSAYQKMKDIGATISDDAALNIDTNIKKELAVLGETDPVQHAGTISALKGLEKKILNGNLSLEALDQSRRTLEGVIRGDTTKNMITGAVIGYGEDALRAKKAIKAIDDSVNVLKSTDLNKGTTEAVSALNQARAAWSKQRKYQDMSRLIMDAGGNPNNLKLRLTRLANNPAKMKNFTLPEQQAIKNAATTTGGEALLNLAGKFGIDLGSSVYQGRTAGAALTLGAAKMATGGAAGYSYGGPEGGMIGAVGAVAGGTIARQIQKWIASGRAEDVLKIIQSGQKLTPAQIGKLSPKAAAIYLAAPSVAIKEKVNAPQQK